MTILTDDFAAQIRAALDEATLRLANLIADRKALSAAIKECRADLERLRKLNKAVTPRSQNGPHE